MQPSSQILLGMLTGTLILVLSALPWGKLDLDRFYDPEPRRHGPRFREDQNGQSGSDRFGPSLRIVPQETAPMYVQAHRSYGRHG